MRFERLIWTSVINLHRSQHLIYSFFIRHHNLTVTSGTSFIPIESFNPFEYIDLHPGERGRETCTSTRHRGTKEEFWIRVFRPFNTYSITDTDKLITIKRIHRLFKLSKFRNNVWRIQEWDIYEHKVCTGTRRIGSVYSDEMTLLLNLWLTISLSLRARTSHPSYLSPHLSSRRKFGFIRPPESPLHARSPTTPSRISLSLSSLARLFGTPPQFFFSYFPSFVLLSMLLSIPHV